MRPKAEIRINDLETRTMEVRQLSPESVGRWEAFVEYCPEATFFHRAGWKNVIEQAFGHQTYFLYAEKAGGIEGVLPLGHIRSRLFGNALVSTPFCVYGGIAAVSEAARIALEKAAEELAVQLNVDYLELRNRSRSQAHWPVKELYVTFRKAIDPDPEKNLQAIPRKQRAMVRKGIQAGLVSEIDANSERFIAAYSESVRNLGTPVFPRKYFQMLCKEFGNDCEVLTVTKDGRTISSVLSFYFRDEVLPYYGGGTEAARRFKSNDFMYWELMRLACERGVRVFDYGRSKKGTGSYSFKKNWGFEPEPLFYQYRLVKADKVPDINPLNPKYRLFIALWKRLPLPVANVIGPQIAKSLG